MEDFLKMKWGISGPHELEHGPEFIPEEKVAESYVFAHLDGAVKIVRRGDITAKSTRKPPVAKVTTPGMNYTFACKRQSRLSAKQQQMCLSALEILQSGRTATTLFEQNNIRLFNDLKRIILDENMLFLEYAKRHFSVAQLKVSLGNRRYAVYSEHAWRQDLTRCLDYAQFYVDTEMLAYSYSDGDVPIEMLHVANVLELGSVAKFNPPSLMHSYTLNANLLQDCKGSTFNSKLPVSRDANIDELLKVNKVDVVISSSTLKKLVDFTNLNCTWCIPIIIKASPGREGGPMVVKTVYLDKPLRKLEPNTEDLHEYCVKKLLKANFCSVKAFSFQNEQVTIPTNKNILKNIPSTGTPQGHTDVLRDSEKTVNGETESEPNAHHNVSYRIWNLQQEEEQNSLNKTRHKLEEFKVLIRCKLDGCEVNDSGMLQPLTVSPKLEYQLQFGGSIPTKTELVKEWTSVYIKPCSQLCRVRTYFKTGEVILNERCNLQKINNEAQVHYEYKPRLGLGVLYKIFLELMKHNPGSYLLLHLPKHGPFVSLLKETKQSGPTVFDLYGEYNERNFKVIPKLQQNWCPVDVNLVLPRHRVSRVMPGMFKPLKNDYEFKKRNKKKTCKNKKKKVK